jgi:hypothetical protein
MNRSSSRTYRAATWRSRVLVAVLGTATGIGVLGVGVAFGYWLTTNGANPAQAVAASLSAPLSPTSTETGSATITVGWTLPGSQLSGAQYQVTRTSGPGSPTTVCTVTSATTSCPDTGLSAGTTYGYSVMAVLHSWQSSTITTSGTALEVTTSSLPGGVVGASYSTTLTAIGGSGTYSHWALGSGTLPSWATLNTSTGAITGTPNAAGTTSGLTFVVTDSLGYTTTSVSLSLTVNPDTATVTAFTVAGSPATYGAETSLVFSTTVASGHGEGIPNTDTVTVTQGATTLCTVTLTSRSGTCSPASATVLAASGSAYTATATFNSAGADPNFITTATKTTSVTVSPDSATVSVFTVAGSPATYGAETSLVFSTTVASGHGEGIPNTDTVTVTQGATTLCTVTLTSRSGTCSPSSATVLGVSGSPYIVTATFNSTGADPNFVTTATKTTSVTVNKDSTITTVSETPTTVTYGNESASIFTASVSATHGEAVPNSETVTVNVGSTSCTVTLTAGTGTCTIGNTALWASVTAYAVSATYAGDTNLTGSTGTAATNLTVTEDSIITTVSETPTTVTYGNESASIFTASVSATHGEAVPNSETVTVNVGSTNCTVTLTAGTGTCTIANMALAASGSAYPVGATYAGDTNLSGSTGSAPTSLIVTKDSTITTVSETPTTVTYGNESASIFTASVSATYGEAAPNSETVTVSVGSTNCTVTLTAGTGTCTIANTALAASGTAYTVGASYAGDTNLSGSTGSASTGLTVSKATQTVTFTTPAPADAAVAGTYAPVASATSGLPVALTIDATTSTVCSISASVVTFNTTGTCTIDANQSGGTNYSAALQFQQTINPVHIGKLVITTPAVSGASSPPSTTTTPNLGQITVQLENGAGMPITTGSILTVALASTSSGGKFGASQFAGTPETTVSIASGTGTASFWYGDSNTGSPTITASATNYVSGTQTETITVAPAGLAIFIAPGSLGTLGSGCTTVSTTYTCNVTGLLAAGSISFYVEFANSSGTQVVYSTTQSSSIAETGQSSGTVTIAAGASTSNPGTLNAVYVVVLGGPSILEFGPYTLTISIS